MRFSSTVVRLNHYKASLSQGLLRYKRLDVAVNAVASFAVSAVESLVQASGVVGASGQLVLNHLEAVRQLTISTLPAQSSVAARAGVNRQVNEILMDGVSAVSALLTIFVDTVVAVTAQSAVSITGDRLRGFSPTVAALSVVTAGCEIVASVTATVAGVGAIAAATAVEAGVVATVEATGALSANLEAARIIQPFSVTGAASTSAVILRLRPKTFSDGSVATFSSGASAEVAI